MNRALLNILSVLLLAILCSVWMSCGSEPLVLKGNPVKTYKSDLVTFTAIFLDELTLKKRYGGKNNPFISVQRAITPRTFIVFDLIIKAEKEKLNLQLNKMELEYAAIRVSPKSRFHLRDYWSLEDDLNESLKPKDTEKKVILINKTVFPDRFAVSPESTVKGLIVFSGNFPKSGTATLSIPFFDGAGNLLDVAELDYQYSLY